jgi:hypothetical protein
MHAHTGFRPTLSALCGRGARQRARAAPQAGAAAPGPRLALARPAQLTAVTTCPGAAPRCNAPPLLQRAAAVATRCAVPQRAVPVRNARRRLAGRPQWCAPLRHGRAVSVLRRVVCVNARDGARDRATQPVATRCLFSTQLQRAVLCCTMLHCVATCCTVLQHAALCCNMLHCGATERAADARDDARDGARALRGNGRPHP